MEIKYLKDAIKHINALDKPTKARIRTAINGLPFGDIKKLKGYSTKFRLRVGNYRIIYDILENMIVINDVLPRGSAYKDL